MKVLIFAVLLTSLLSSIAVAAPSEGTTPEEQNVEPQRCTLTDKDGERFYNIGDSWTLKPTTSNAPCQKATCKLQGSSPVIDIEECDVLKYLTGCELYIPYPDRDYPGCCPALACA